jgi:hypothetical protein
MPTRHQDDDRPVIDRQPSEGTLELVTMEDAGVGVGRSGFLRFLHGTLRDPSGLLPRLCEADADQQSIRPALEARRLAKTRQIVPDVQERLLDCVFGEMRVAEDAYRDRLQASVAPQGERFERPLVASLCCHHEIAVHTLDP